MKTNSNKFCRLKSNNLHPFVTLLSIHVGVIPLLLIPHLQIITARKGSLGQGNIFTGMCLSTRGGACSDGGACSRGCLVETPRTATAVGSTHPTGMHSCYFDGFL